MLRKVSLVAVLLLCISGASLVAYSYIWATSNVVHVEVQYAVDLTVLSVEDSDITLSAAVTNDGAPVRLGIIVDFYCSVDGGNWTHFVTSFTNAGGVAQATYAAANNGAYDFKAVATVP